MKHCLHLFLLSCLWNISTPVFAQQENVWAFGNRGGLNFNGSNPPAVLQTAITGSGASVCDANGQLLFYTNGSTIWNAGHQVMLNSDDLTGLGPMPFNISPTETSQGALIAPMIDSPGKYFVFSLTCKNLYTVTSPPLGGRLYYSVVNMALNGGMGAVEPGRKGILIDSNLTEKMTAIVGDNCNVWLLVCSKDESQFKAFEITKDSINTLPVISYSGITSPITPATGTMTASPDRHKIARAKFATYLIGFSLWGLGGLEVYDFDPGTGLVSNGLVLDGNYSNPLNHARTYCSVAFSPNSTKVYGVLWDDIASNYMSEPDSAGRGVPYLLYQFDLDTPNPPATKTLISSCVYTQLKLGPDGKMYYFGSPRTHLNGQYLDVLHTPDWPGNVSQWQPYFVQFSTTPWLNGRLPNVVPVIPKDTVSTINEVVAGCFQDSVLLQAWDITGQGYTWHTGGSSGVALTAGTPGLYTVHYTTPCTYHIDSFRVSFPNALPQTGSKDCMAWAVLPPGNQVSYHYTWLDAAGKVLSATVSTHGDTIRGLTPGMLYRVHIKTAGGCDTVLSVAIHTDYPIAVDFAVDSVACVDQLTQFFNISSGPDAVRSKWQFGDGNNSETDQPGHIYRATGDYLVVLEVEDAIGCRYSTGKHITIKDFNLEVNANSDLVNYGGLILLTTSAAEPYTITRWEPETLFPDQNASIQHLRTDSTRQYRAMALSIINGCSSSDTVTVAVRRIMPSAFSPNGDGLNDYFRPAGNGMFIALFQVYNRWGQLVWEGAGKTADQGWDGRRQGSPADAGTYFWITKMEGPAGKWETRKGDVLLIR